MDDFGQRRIAATLATRRQGLFFIAGDSTLMAVPVTPGAAFSAGKPTACPSRWRRT